MLAHAPFFRRVGGRTPRWLLGLACAGLWLLGTGAGRGYFVLILDETADAWPSGSAPSELVVPALTDFDVKNTLLFSQQGLDAGDVASLRINQVGLVMVAPTQQPNFAFVHALRVLAVADGLPEVTVAEGTDLAAGTNFVGLDVHDVDLAPYVRAPHFSLRGVVDAADAAPADTTLRLVLNLQAYVAQPSAACGRAR